MKDLLSGCGGVYHLAHVEDLLYASDIFFQLGIKKQTAVDALLRPHWQRGPIWSGQASVSTLSLCYTRSCTRSPEYSTQPCSLFKTKETIYMILLYDESESSTSFYNALIRVSCIDNGSIRLENIPDIVILSGDSFYLQLCQAAEFARTINGDYQQLVHFFQGNVGLVVKLSKFLLRVLFENVPHADELAVLGKVLRGITSSFSNYPRSASALVIRRVINYWGERRARFSSRLTYAVCPPNSPIQPGLVLGVQMCVRPLLRFRAYSEVPCQTWDHP